MAAAVLHCKSDTVNCGTAHHAGDPHHLPHRSPEDYEQRPPPPLNLPVGGPRQTKR